jgi:hypothetical protein
VKCWSGCVQHQGVISRPREAPLLVPGKRFCAEPAGSWSESLAQSAALRLGCGGEAAVRRPIAEDFQAGRGIELAAVVGPPVRGHGPAALHMAPARPQALG